MDSKRTGKWRSPFILIVLVGLAIAITYLTGTTLRAGITMMLGGSLLILLFLWFIFRSPLSWRGRFLGGLGFLMVLGGVASMLQMDGSADGTSMPNFIWKWTPKKGEGLEVLPEMGVEGLASTAVAHRDATQFLGDDARSGVFADVKMAVDWDKNPPKEIWRIPVGLGYGGFSVAGDRILTQEQRDDEELLTCYDLGSGAFLWAHRNKVRFSETLGGDGPRSTPTIDADAGLVYAMGTTGILDCVRLDSGALVWSQNVLEGSDGGLPTYGKPNAPLLHGDFVIVSGSDRAPTLLAYGRADGAPAWRAGENGAGYSSPALLDVNGVPQIVSVNSENVTGHDPLSGAVQWTYPWKAQWPKSAQPRSVGDGRILLTASYGMGTHLIQVKGNAVEELWSAIRMKTKFSSVCVLGNYAYGLDEGVFSCIDITNGERMWKDGRYGFGQNILADGVLIVQGEQGGVFLVEATPDEHRELASIEVLKGKTWNTPTLAAPYLILRNDTEAVCLLLPAP